MDVALIYGRAVPRMTNKTKVPSFLSNPPKTKDVVEWGDHEQTEYDRLSDVNKSWQNLVVDRHRLGAREKKPENEDSVPERDDVRLEGERLVRGQHYVDPGAVNQSLAMLALWVAGCYGVAALSLYRRQTGR
jgi:hypothetical protein